MSVPSTFGSPDRSISTYLVPALIGSGYGPGADDAARGHDAAAVGKDHQRAVALDEQIRRTPRPVRVDQREACRDRPGRGVDDPQHAALDGDHAVSVGLDEIRLVRARDVVVRRRIRRCRDRRRRRPVDRTATPAAAGARPGGVMPQMPTLRAACCRRPASMSAQPVYETSRTPPTAVPAVCGTELLESPPVAVDTQTSPAATTTTAPTPNQILTPLRRWPDGRHVLRRLPPAARTWPVRTSNP